jgi:hypothetical protein
VTYGELSLVSTIRWIVTWSNTKKLDAVNIVFSK